MHAEPNDNEATRAARGGRRLRGSSAAKVVAIRLNEEELVEIDRLAQRAGLSRSDLVRRALAAYSDQERLS